MEVEKKAFSRKCECRWCLQMSPKIKSVQDSLKEYDPHLLDDFTYIIDELIQAGDDRDYWESKAKGTWTT